MITTVLSSVCIWTLKDQKLHFRITWLALEFLFDNNSEVGMKFSSVGFQKLDTDFCYIQFTQMTILENTILWITEKNHALFQSYRNLEMLLTCESIKDGFGKFVF